MPAAGTDADVLIPLRGGFSCRTSVAMWLIDASWRLRFRVVGAELEVSPQDAITPADDRFIRAHRDELVACVVYIDRLAEVPV